MTLMTQSHSDFKRKIGGHNLRIWTKTEDDLIRHLFAQKVGTGEIARQLNSNDTSIRRKVVSLGLREKQQPYRGIRKSEKSVNPATKVVKKVAEPRYRPYYDAHTRQMMAAGLQLQRLPFMGLSRNA